MKKVFCVVSIILIMIVQTIAVYAEDIIDREHGYVEIGNQVTILNEEGLKYFADQVNAGNDYAGKVVSLSADLDLKNELWTPIGYGDRDNALKNIETLNFAGIFDGYNHTIKNLNIDCGTDKLNVGLFGIIKNGQVKNLIIESGTIKNEAGTAGAIVGGMYGDNAVLANCVVKSDVKIIANAGGGVAGRCQSKDNYVYECENYSTIEGVGEKAKSGGVLCFSQYNIIVYKNKNYGNITGGTTGIGGVVGYVNATGYDALIVSNENYGNMSNNTYVGGIVGYVTGNNGYIVNCLNKGDMNGNNATG